MPPRRPTIGVCLATFQRPEGLDAVLAGIAAQTARAERDLTVFIADNDPQQSARPIVERWSHSGELVLGHVAEPRRGVVHARNAAVQLALDAGVDCVVFIDDDELPSPQWLEHLLETQRTTGAPIVTGPVIETLGSGTPRWYRKGRFHAMPDLLDGSPVPYAACGNALYDASILATLAGPFDERFNRSGGEDVYLSLCLARDGATIVWSRNAVVTTEVPLERMSLGHLVRRNRIGAANYTRAERLVNGRRPARFVTGLGRVGLGLATVVAGALSLSLGRASRGAVGMAQGVGVILGAAGIGVNDAWWTS